MKNKLSNENGQTVVLLAMFLGIVGLGFLAFALDIGFIFHEKRMAQAAADAAAVAAAEEYSYGNTSNVQAAANAAATLNGFNTSATTNPAVVTISYPSSGNYSNVGSATAPSTWVEAVVSKPVPTFFLGAFRSSMNKLTVTASAVSGGGQTSPTCVCLEGTTGQDLNMSNDSSLVGSSCGITVDSSSSNAAGIVGSASVCAQTLGSVSSNWDNSSNVNNAGTICSSTKVIQGISTSCSPAMPAPPTYTASSCTADPLTHYGNGGSAYSVGPGSTYSTTQTGNLVCYTSLTVGSNNDAVTLNAGAYVISGGELHFESGNGGHSNLGGNGVLFYLTNGASLVIDNGANVNLVAGGNTESGGSTAPTTGIYNGILFFEDPGNGGSDAGDSAAVSVQGGSSAYLNGGLYAPLAAITLGNGSGTNINADIVAKSLTMNGGGTLTSTANSNLGTLNMSVAKITQ